MTIYDPLANALGLSPIEFIFNITEFNHTKVPVQDGVGFKHGNIPWNKGLNNEDPRIKKISTKMAETKKNQGFYNSCGKYLPKMYGDTNPMKNPENKKKISSIASTRYRIYREDGSWYWGHRPL
jgi:hypothetical protein